MIKMSINKSTKKLTQEFILEKCRSLPNADNYDFSKITYQNIRTKILLICCLHGEFSILPRKILDGYGCAICDKLSNNLPKVHLTLEQYKVFAAELHKNKYDYSLVDNLSSEKIPIICPNHGVFMGRRSAHISPTQQYGCQKCSRGYSKTEALIEEFLKTNHIEYEYQKTYDDLVGGSNQRLPYDFYIASKNILIEFDGPHHFMKIKFSKDQSEESQERKLKQVKENDSRKNHFIFADDLRLVRIKYTRTKDIERILNFELLDIPYIEGRNFDGPLKTVIHKQNQKIGELIDYF